MQNQTILLSICVAVYNIKEEYLRACIESIISDLSDRAEMILGDDGSDEETAKICREYADGDCRIKYVRPEKNSGVSYIRNIMTDRASGETVTFVDGDDVVSHGYSKAICKALSLSDKRYDIVMFEWQRFENSVPYIKAEDTEIMPVSPCAAKKFSKACLTGAPPHTEKYGIDNSTPSSVCIKAYRREFLIKNSLKFKVGLEKSQDVEFNTRAFCECRSLGYLPQVLYLYRKNPDSVTNRYNPNIKKVLYDCIECDRKNLETLYHNDREPERLWKKYKLIHYIISFFELDVFHSDNPKSESERKADFIGFIEEEPFAEFFRTFDFSAYRWKERRLILRLAADKRFGVLNFMFKNPIAFRVYGKLKSIRDGIGQKTKRG